jgi:hypothetical protein
MPHEKLPQREISMSREAHDLLVGRKEPIDPMRFKDEEREGYKEDQIQDDINEVSRREEEFKKENTPEENKIKEYSDMVEALISQEAELSDWFGEDVFVYDTSKYDDLENGVDIVTEFKEEGVFSHMGLAIDVTFGTNIRGKLLRIKREIKSGELASVKYFSSQRDNESDKKVGLKNIPRVIIGTNKETVDELSGLWLQREKLRKSKFTDKSLTDVEREAISDKLSEVNKKIRNHKIQIHVLKQLAFQLEKYYEFAMKKEKTDVAKKLNTGLDIIKKILASKKDTEEKDEFLEILETKIDNILHV